MFYRNKMHAIQKVATINCCCLLFISNMLFVMVASNANGKNVDYSKDIAEAKRVLEGYLKNGFDAGTFPIVKKTVLNVGCDFVQKQEQKLIEYYKLVVEKVCKKTASGQYAIMVDDGTTAMASRDKLALKQEIKDALWNVFYDEQNGLAAKLAQPQSYWRRVSIQFVVLASNKYSQAKSYVSSVFNLLRQQQKQQNADGNSGGNDEYQTWLQFVLRKGASILRQPNVLFEEMKKLFEIYSKHEGMPNFLNKGNNDSENDIVAIRRRRRKRTAESSMLAIMVVVLILFLGMLQVHNFVAFGIIFLIFFLGIQVFTI